MLFPEFEIVVNTEGDVRKVWDISRKKWIIYTPEEEVRQHLLHYFVREKGVPLSMIAVEKEIKLYKRKKRFDVVVFDKSGNPLILCECKAPEIEITQMTVYQIGEYNLILKAPYLLITNGKSLFFYQVSENGVYTPLSFMGE
ncbi:MAG: type I restriction enzyme HsdR N-terminal domain-containing protein [Bacteroidia bacterium]|nr:type I restriction enzyme HsdR N-terminal domain-containing protein [Bacteroidia bacterium]